MFVISVIGYLVYATGQPALAWVFKYFVDGITNSYSNGLFNIPIIWGFPIFIVFIALFQGVGSFLGSYYMAKVSLLIAYNLRKKLYYHLINMPIAFFDQHKTGFLISRVTNNVNNVTNSVTESLKTFFREGFTLIGLLIYLFWMNWKLTIIIFITLPAIGLVTKRVSSNFRKLSKDMLSAMGDITQVLSEGVKSIRVVKGFNREGHEIEKFGEANRASYKRSLKMNRMGASFTPIVQLITYFSLAIIMGLVLYFRGDSTPGDLVAYITALCLLPKPIRQLSELTAQIQKGITSAENIFDFLDKKAEIDDGVLDPDKILGKIEFKNLSFSYPKSNKQILKSINLSIQAGKTVAIVGHSGSGKSTLANLIPRFYYCDHGQIFIDDYDINNYKLSTLRSNIALVTQDISLFNDSIYNNIAYGCPDADETAIFKAAQLSNVAEFVHALPEGFDTVIGDNGILLSGGQRQRISIARALIKNAPILILDEATSALDTKSEGLIKEAIKNISANRTTLIIAHRLSTIEHADLIIVLENGEILESGTHSDLIKSGGAYSELYSSYSSDEINAKS